MSRYLEQMIREKITRRQVEAEAVESTRKSNPTPGRIESWRRWNITRTKHRHAATRERDRDIAGRMAAFMSSLTPEQRDGMLILDELLSAFAPHNRSNVAAALRAAGWGCVQRRTATGRRWVWVWVGR